MKCFDPPEKLYPLSFIFHPEENRTLRCCVPANSLNFVPGGLHFISLRFIVSRRYMHYAFRSVPIVSQCYYMRGPRVFNTIDLCTRARVVSSPGDVVLYARAIYSHRNAPTSLTIDRDFELRLDASRSRQNDVVHKTCALERCPKRNGTRPNPSYRSRRRTQPCIKY